MSAGRAGDGAVNSTKIMRVEAGKSVPLVTCTTFPYSDCMHHAAILVDPGCGLKVAFLPRHALPPPPARFCYPRPRVSGSRGRDRRVTPPASTSEPPTTPCATTSSWLTWTWWSSRAIDEAQCSLRNLKEGLGLRPALPGPASSRVSEGTRSS